VLLPEEEVQHAVRTIRTALLRHESLTLTQAAAETQFAERILRQAFDQLTATGAFVVVDVPGLGLAITRR
jgi:hypothetical protein